MKFRMPGAAALVLSVVLGASGCTPAPEPAPVPSASFASDEEAFVAAEETYRAYVDALNQVDLSDPATFEAVYAWTTGEASVDARKSFTQMHADSWDVRGESRFDHFLGTGVNADGATTVVSAQLCMDVSDVELVDSEGQSLVPEQRNDRQPVAVTFVSDSFPSTPLAISTSLATEADTCG